MRSQLEMKTRTSRVRAVSEGTKSNDSIQGEESTCRRHGRPADSSEPSRAGLRFRCSTEKKREKIKKKFHVSHTVDREEIIECPLRTKGRSRRSCSWSLGYDSERTLSGRGCQNGDGRLGSNLARAVAAQPRGPRGSPDGETITGEQPPERSMRDG